MFEHKKANHREHNALYYIGKSREVRRTSISVYSTNISCKIFTFTHDMTSALTLIINLSLGGALWNLCNRVTPLSNWRKYGIAVKEISILWLKTTGFHAFVLVMEVAVFVLNLSMLSPLNKPMK